MNASGTMHKFQPVQLLLTSESIEITGPNFGSMSLAPDDVIGVEETDIRWNDTGIGMSGLTRSLGSKMNRNNTQLNSVRAPA